MAGKDPELVVIQPPPAAGASCAARPYLTGAEIDVLAEMRRVRDEIRRVTRQLRSAALSRPEMPGAAGDAADSEERRAELARQLERLRHEWRDLTRRRDEAWHAKLVALGHRAP